MATLTAHANSLYYDWLKGTNPGGHTPHFAYFDGDPQGAGTEYSADFGGRVPMSFGLAASREVLNDALLESGAATASRSIGYWGIYDALTGGNLLASGQFRDGGLTPQTYTINSGDKIRVAIGAIKLSCPAGMLTDYGAHKLLNLIAGVDPGASPSLFAAYYNGDPTGAGVEKTDTINTARQAVTLTGTGPITNGNLVNYGAAVAQDTADYLAILDSSTIGAGNILIYKAMTQAITPEVNDPVTIPIGNLSLTLV